MSIIEKKVITDAELLKLIVNLNRMPEMVCLNTYSDIRFYPKNSILLFRRMNDPLSKHACWEVMFTDSTTKKLTSRVTAEKLFGQLSLGSFIKINQSCILNRAFLLGISYKTRNCELYPPYNKIILTASRMEFTKIKAHLFE